MERTQFQETLARLKASFKKGEVAEVAKEAQVSEPTLRKAFTRAYPTELTDAERRVINICMERFKARLAEGAELEQSLRTITEGGGYETLPSLHGKSSGR